jgi:hypothetical protein
MRTDPLASICDDCRRHAWILPAAADGDIGGLRRDGRRLL